MNRLAPVLAMALLLFASLTIAGPEKVAFPPYQTHVLYTVVDRPDIEEIRDVYVNPETTRMPKPGQPLPSGTVLTFVHFKANADEKGLSKLVRAPK